MEFHGVLGDRECRSNFLVHESVGEHLQNFAFARRERLSEFVQLARASGRRGKSIGGDLRRNLRGMQHEQAAGGGLQRGNELLGGDVVWQNGANTLTKRSERRGESRRFHKDDDVEVGREARSDERVEKRFERFTS